MNIPSPQSNINGEKTKLASQRLYFSHTHNLWANPLLLADHTFCQTCWRIGSQYMKPCRPHRQCYVQLWTPGTHECSYPTIFLVCLEGTFTGGALVDIVEKSTLSQQFERHSDVCTDCCTDVRIERWSSHESNLVSDTKWFYLLLQKSL